VTPLAYVVLVLLITMMLVAPMLQQAVSVELPAAASAVDKPEMVEQTVVAIGRDRQMYLNAKAINEGDLGTKTTELLENAKERIVLIKVDEEVEYGAVMAAVDQLRQAGIEDIVFITERKKGAEGRPFSFRGV
jgi:biopolymer transport protein TolR